jgi:uncharacterized protein YjbI with pentapeptide repeats
MSEVKKKCKYKSKFTSWQCPYEALEDSKDSFCIFHERRKDKDIEKFNMGIKGILEDKECDAYHFDGFFFPSSIDFSKLEFEKDVFFTLAEFVGERTDFSIAKFIGQNTDFSRAKFSGKETQFIGAGFLGQNTDFSQAKFSGKSTLFMAEFSSTNTDFMEAEFSGEYVIFAETKFSGEFIDFTNAEFSGGNTLFRGGEFSARDTRFDLVKFAGRNTRFRGVEFSGENISFMQAEFSGEEVSFYYSRFLKRILFDRTIFKAKTSFTGVDLSKCVFTEVDLRNVDFNLLTWDWNQQLENETELEKLREELEAEKHEFYFKTSEIYRQLKVQFHNKRDFAKAGIFHFREQECKRKAYKPLSWDFFNWIFLWILKLSCGYGEKLRNVGLTSVGLIFLFAFSYMFLGLHNADDSASLVFNYDLGFKNMAPITTILKDFWTSLIFSIKGFFPLWRFQQYKVVGDFANLVAGIEFLLGAFMVGLFVYVFRRRMDK